MLATAVVCATVAFADTIVLKNGRRIYADRVREANGKVEYEVGDDSFSIAKGLVDHVEGGGVAPTRSGTSGTTAAEKLPAEVAPRLPNEEQLHAKIVKDGDVDLQALTAATRGGGSAAAAAYFVAGKTEYIHGDFAKAQQYLISALGEEPHQPVILDQLALVLSDMHHYSEALSYARQAVVAADNSADTHTVLGWIYFHSDRTKDAITEFKRAQAIHPDAGVQSMLELAQRESHAESGFGEQSSGHFNFRFEGDTPRELRAQLLTTLEAHYDELARVFGSSPHQSITVSLYSEQAFFDVTRAPGWTAAENDGKLRIPVQGLTGVTPELSRVLKHELAHSFIAEITRNRCPVWLHEGVAQYVEGETSRAAGPTLAKIFTSGNQVPLRMLEGSFFTLNSREASLAYAESLAAVEYVVSTYGMSDVVVILRRLGAGASPEDAIRAAVHVNYSSFESDVGTYLKKTYGAN